MSETSYNLDLPFLFASQTQKHLSFNELVNKIDTLLMLKIESINLTAPPQSPQEGQRYIIAPNATGEWAGKSGKIALWQNLAWEYINPKAGFIAFIQSLSTFKYFENEWKDLVTLPTIFSNLSQIGIGTNADINNPFSAKINSALLSSKYSSENGNGNIRFKLNKEAITNTASLIFQNDWSGRAECGLIGNDFFALKTSTDGNVWDLCYSVNPATNITHFTKPISFPSFTDGANAIIKTDDNNFIHASKAIGTVGNNVFIGLNTGNNPQKSVNSYDGSYNLGIGFSSLSAISSGFNNVGIGANALLHNTTGVYNTAIGADSLQTNISGSLNTAIGKGALQNSLGDGNISIGVESAFNNASGSFNTNIGSWASYNNVSGSYNTSIGLNALRYKTDGTPNTSYSNCTAIGAETRVSGSNQVQLGGSGTTTYAFGAIQDRSDMRDKANIRDTILGLDFICALRPVDFQWDMRDDYIDTLETIDENGIKITKSIKIKKDGSRRRNRFHHGLIAQEVRDVFENLNVDFGGFQDHSKNGGDDVLSIGYTELIAPLIKAIQELRQEIIDIKQS